MTRLLIVAAGVTVGAAAALEARWVPPHNPGRPAYGQERAAQTSTDVDALLREGERLLSSQKAADAKAMFDRALAGAHGLSLESQTGAAHCGLARALHALAQYQPAFDAATRCLEIYTRIGYQPGIGQANLSLSAAADLMGNRAVARTHADRSLAAFEATGNVRARFIATLQVIRVNPRSAETEALYARIVDAAIEAGDRNLEGNARHSWGDYLFNTGRLEDSLVTLERAATVYEATGDRVAMGTVFNSLGRLYRVHGRLDEALAFQMKALAIHEREKSPFELMQSLNAVAVVQGMLGRTAESRRYFERALAVGENTSPRIQDFLRANIAGLWIDEGQFEEGARVLEGVLERALDAYPSLRYGRLSYAYSRMGRIDKAVPTALRAVETCRPATSECITARANLSVARAASGDRAAALAELDTALAAIEEMRAKLVPADFLRQEFHRHQEYVYSQAIALKLSENQADAALETAELARSRALLDLLAGRNLRLPGQAAAAEGVPAGAAPATVAEIAATASRLHSVFVLYWQTDDELCIWVVPPEGPTRARRVPVLRARLHDLVRSTSLDLDAAPGRTAAWRELYELLIAPIADVLPRTPGALLTIVPDGPLHHLSFAALQDGRGRYLLEKYAIHYVPAAAVLQLTQPMRRADSRAGDVLLVADPALPRLSKLDRPLPRLPGARTEADAIARLVPGRRVTRLTDATATEVAVRDAAADRHVVHFATHAVVRDDDPLSSFLALGPARDAAADGVLTAAEIYTWNLHADLVVLSACRSGGGRITGDGIAAFTRAFLYAGTPTLMASLWDVADEPTNRLLPAFYRSWLGGQSKARALRAAQLQLLADLRAGRVQLQTAAGAVVLPEHPAFWAGFALIGEPD
jgi:CHAT domain-containing protein